MAGTETPQDRIGDFLVSIGVMSPEQRDTVVQRQETEPDRLFGEIAIELGYIDDAAVDKYLDSRR